MVNRKAVKILNKKDLIFPLKANRMVILAGRVLYNQDINIIKTYFSRQKYSPTFIVINHVMIKQIIVLLISVLTFSQHLSGQVHFNRDNIFRYISMPVQIDNSNLKFIFDTGNQKTLIFIDDKNKLKDYKVIGKTFFTDANGKRDTVFIINGIFKIPELKITKSLNIAAVLTQPDFMKSMGITGILGNDIISAYNWDIDFVNNTITPIKLNRHNNTNQFIKLAGFRDKYGTLATLVCSKNFKDTFEIDFGFNGIVDVNKDISLPDIFYTKHSFGETLTDRIDTTIITIDSLNFMNSLCFQNIPVSQTKGRVSNLIGMDFLTKFNEVFIDNKNAEVWVLPSDTLHFIIPVLRTYKNKIMSLTYNKSKPIDLKLKLGESISDEEASRLRSKYDDQLTATLKKDNACSCNLKK